MTTSCLQNTVDKERVGLKESTNKLSKNTSNGHAHKKKKKHIAPKKKTAEEIFYATMNGDAMSVVDGIEALILAASEEKNDEFEEDGPLEYYAVDNDFDEFPDANSFACFDIYQKASKEAKGAGKAIVSENGSSGGEISSTASSSFTVPSDNQDEISLSDIQRYVMDHLPDDVKKSIPEEAWKQIINDMRQAASDGDDRSAATTKSTKEALKQLIKEKYTRSSKPDMLDFQDDDISVLSEITTHTATLQKEDQQQQKKKSNTKTSSGGGFYYPPTPSLVAAGQSSGSEQQTTRKKKTVGVKFDHVSVRYYQRVLEFNPSVTNGPPIGIGWKYKPGGSCTVDQWEVRKKERTVTQVRRRPAASHEDGEPLSSSSPLLLPRLVRESMLHDLGYTQKEIAQAIRTVRKLKDQRRTTVDNLNVQSVEEAMENATHLMKSLLRVGRRKGIVR